MTKETKTMLRRNIHASSRTSFHISDALQEAMAVIRDAERVLKSAQVEIGLKLYMERHKKLLAAHGIDLWKGN